MNLIHSEDCEAFGCSLCDSWINVVSIPLGNLETQNFKPSESEALGAEASKLCMVKSLSSLASPCTHKALCGCLSVYETVPDLYISIISVLCTNL